MNVNHIKIAFTALLGCLSSLLGVLELPVLLVVSCNIIDYITGLMASPYRSQDINSYTSIRYKSVPEMQSHIEIYKETKTSQAQRTSALSVSHQ